MTDTKASILIVEDEEPARISLRAVLEMEGYFIGEADSGTAAIELASQRCYDVLLVDYRLPDMNGIECIKQVASLCKECIPIIITGSNSLEIALQAMRIGAHDYFIKPVNLDELKTNVAHVLVEREEFRKGRLRFPQVIKEMTITDEQGIEVIIQEAGHEDAVLARKGNLLTVALHKGRDAFRLMRRFFWDIY